jgi:pimeloyl-ACP methyl ester carboxylesterase
MTRIFLHGLESSSKGAKSSFLRTLFPDMLIPDFKGSLSERMASLEVILTGMEDIIMVGSSFGGLMATIYAMERQESLDRLVLLAPALNFPEFFQYKAKSIKVPTRVIIGSVDNVTPVQEVLPLARKIFVDLNYDEVDDGHMLAKTFRNFDWQIMLAE